MSLVERGAEFCVFYLIKYDNECVDDSRDD